MFIHIENMSFRYSRKRVVFEGLNLTIESFPMVILGPNGAGKSTLLSLLAGQVRSSSGTIKLGGAPTNGDRISLRELRSLTGWLPQEVQAVPGFSCREQVAYAGWLKGMRYDDAWRSALATLAEMDLQEHANRPAADMSGGQRRRLGIAQALVHSPSYLLLDEPYAGLDPEQRSLVRDSLTALASTTSILVSTHQTEDLEERYAQVLILGSGQPVYFGRIEDFYSRATPGTESSMRAESAYRQILGANRTSL